MVLTFGPFGDQAAAVGLSGLSASGRAVGLWPLVAGAGWGWGRLRRLPFARSCFIAGSDDPNEEASDIAKRSFTAWVEIIEGDDGEKSHNTRIRLAGFMSDSSAREAATAIAKASPFKRQPKIAIEHAPGRARGTLYNALLQIDGLRSAESALAAARLVVDNAPIAHLAKYPRIFKVDELP